MAEEKQEPAQREMEDEKRPEKLRSGGNCLAHDEAIMAQQDRIQQEVRPGSRSLRCSQGQGLIVLCWTCRGEVCGGVCACETWSNPIMCSSLISPCILNDPSAVPAGSKHTSRNMSKVDLVTQGFTEFTIEDFHNTFMDLIELVEKQGSVTDLLNGFNEQSTSDYLVVYLRLLTSGYLQREGGLLPEGYINAVLPESRALQEVEPMSKESDHIHIIALAQALNVSILVEYMDRGEGSSVNHHVFPEGSEPRVYLLYRPGHYDILYK
ncbi:ubiquitin thioesterase OTUB1 [Huso huso]|uniref:Ubiquitin thioesterase OTUB1 n=1 Tax=Huso huso TaxID=61971 RepID=A0ABR0YYU1_HUSHU